MVESHKKVVLGMSGGVDSSVSVHLLQQAGYEVIGVHMQMIPQAYAPPSTALEDARKVAEHLKIPFHVLDVRDAFQELVIDYFIQEYYRGRTPNPCIICNKHLKFKIFAQYAQELGGDFIATGHYAKIEQDAQGHYQLKKGDDPQKDQSYFLFNIEPELLPKILFPLCAYSKEETRAIATQLGLEVAQKADSQEICFIQDNDYKRFLVQAAQSKISVGGDFIDFTGQKIGRHQGIQNYTIGQRKGLGVALGKPAYVVAIDPLRNQVTLGDDDQLQKTTLIASHNHFLGNITVGQPVSVEAKVRYRAQPAAAILTLEPNGEARLVFDQPQRAITPGQGVCYYQGDTVLGGGMIEGTIDNS